MFHLENHYVSKKPLGIYIHWPFCATLCPYCDFNRTKAVDINPQLWIDCYKKEIDYYLEQAPINKYIITSIFFGGGTPSLMPPIIVSEIINYIKNNFLTNNPIEITLESNPSSTEEQKFLQFAESGVNRLSLGIQAFNDEDLSFLGRNHTVADSLKAITTAAKTFKNYTFDLIYGRHDKQTLQSWQDELKIAIDLRSDHLSLYNLTIEKGTEFYRQKVKGSLPVIDPSINEEMYFATNEFMQNAGFERYEISNFCRDQSYSVHNMHYWLINDYIGLGPGAHGRIFYKNGQRTQTMTFHNYQKWLDYLTMNQSALQTNTAVEKLSQIKEILMGGLRINQGINLGHIKDHLNLDLLQEVGLEKLKKAGDLKLITYSDHYIKPTEKGRDLLSQVIDILL